MLTILTGIICGILIWFDAYHDMCHTCDGDNWGIFVMAFCKYMRYPFIAMLVDLIITLVIILTGMDDVKYALWDIGIYV